jgi:hypothetical protein
MEAVSVVRALSLMFVTACIFGGCGSRSELLVPDATSHNVTSAPTSGGASTTGGWRSVGVYLLEEPKPPVASMGRAASKHSAAQCPPAETLPPAARCLRAGCLQLAER